MASARIAQKEIRRQLLLDTALRFFDTKGFAATTVDDIVSAAGATRTTFYLHFRSKMEVMRALLEQVTEQTIGSADRELASVVRDGDPTAIAEWLGRAPELWQVLRVYLNAAHEAASIDPEMRSIVEDWIQTAIDDIALGLNQADRFDPDTRAIRGVLAFSQLEHLSRRWMVRGCWDMDRDQTLSLLADSWVRLLVE
jgi:AcrR family transcriptional regulator